MYINPIFEQYAEEREGENPLKACSKQDPMVLDLTQSPYAEVFAKYMDDDKIAKKPIIRSPENKEDIPFQRQLDENLANFLRTAFLQQYPQYENSFTIFSFVNDEVEGLPGFCEVAADVKTKKFSHFKQNVVLFGNRKSTTLSHEALHGLGLHHTHLDNEVIEEREIKYVFKRKTTDNIMSYASSRKTTWHWQWEIVRDKNK